MNELARLDPMSVEAVARRVVELLLAASVVPAVGHVDTATVARMLSVSHDWVRDHAAELGAVRLGDGPKGELRFDVESVRVALERRRLAPARASTPPRSPGPRRRPRGVELLPLPQGAHR